MSLKEQSTELSENSTLLGDKIGNNKVDRVYN